MNPEFDDSELEYNPQQPVVRGIYLGSRGEDFRMMIKNILKNGKLNKKYIDILTTDENMQLYSSAFTSELIDENNNYQVLEQLGDLTGNKILVSYFYTRFPFLKCAEGVKIVARLRINYGSKKEFCKVGESLGFWPFISTTIDARMRRKKALLEDVFEAFLGATESILDATHRPGFGYSVCYKLLAGIYDKIPISLRYEDLYDAKTRLKELFDSQHLQLGKLNYRSSKEGEDCGGKVTTIVFREFEGKTQKLGQGSASTKKDAEQQAAEAALRKLAKDGFKKKVSGLYLRIQKDAEERSPSVKGKTPNGEKGEKGEEKGEDKEDETPSEEDIKRIIESKSVEGNPDINSQIYTKGKSKYKTEYTSTLLGMYCRKRDYGGITACLSLGASPNEVDIEGLSCLDLLLIGEHNPKFVKKVIKAFKVVCSKKLLIHPEVKKHYLDLYLDRTFFQNLSLKEK